MKKYRYGAAPTGKASKWTRRLNFLYFALAWNAFGLILYSYYRGDNVDPEWKKLTGAQKYLYFMSEPDRKITVLNVDGLTVQESKEMTMGEFTGNYQKPEKNKQAVSESE